MGISGHSGQLNMLPWRNYLLGPSHTVTTLKVILSVAIVGVNTLRKSYDFIWKIACGVNIVLSLWTTSNIYAMTL